MTDYEREELAERLRELNCPYQVGTTLATVWLEGYINGFEGARKMAEKVLESNHHE